MMSILVWSAARRRSRRSPPGERRAGPRQVFVLHVVVIGADDGFLALEVVVGGAERETRAGGDVANGRFLEAALTEQGERGVENLAAGLLAGGALRDGAAGGCL